MTECPCGSGKSYDTCCGPYIAGRLNPPTAEALMRSRYTAYAKGAIDYIEATHSPEKRDNLDIEETRRWAEESEWQGLEILECREGGPGDTAGTVEFTARYRQKGRDYEHHEVSSFRKEGGQWFFQDGNTPRQTYTREAPKVGRNDPCPCGSGKKYKKCCGR